MKRTDELLGESLSDPAGLRQSDTARESGTDLYRAFGVAEYF